MMAVLTMTTVQGQTLTERQKGLAACACLMAQGDLERLEPAVRQALDNGVTINELKEALSQLYAYTGFPRSLNALGVLSKVLQEGNNPNWKEGKPWKRPKEWDDARKAYELGKKNQTQLSGKPFDYAFCPQNDYYLKSHRPALGCRSRDCHRSSTERSRRRCPAVERPQAGRRKHGQQPATGG